MTITTLNHPFQVGTEVLVTRTINYRRVLIRKARVAKAHKNGIVVLETLNGSTLGDNFRPCNFNNRWTLTEIARRYGSESYYLSTPEIVEALSADEAEAELDSRKRAVSGYIQSRLASRDLNLSADQLARINAIINE